MGARKEEKCDLNFFKAASADRFNIVKILPLLPPALFILPLPADLHQCYLCRHVLDSYSQLAASPTPPSWLPEVEKSGEVAFIASFHVKTFIATVLEGSPVLQTIVWSRSS